MSLMNAYNTMQPPPGIGGFGPEWGDFIQPRPGGFSPPGINGPVGMGGRGGMGGAPMGGMGGGPQMGGGGGGGGLGGMWGSLGPLEQAYLVSQGLSGIGNWWQGRQDRKEDKRRYDEQTALDRQHRRKMGSSWQAAYG